MKLEDRIAAMRGAALREGRQPVPVLLQGVSRERTRAALTLIDRGSDVQVDAVFALLDDTQPSWCTPVRARKKFSDGATTAHIACHVGILQRGKTKMDREGRDYWIKPLRDVGAVEPVTLVDGEFIAAHVVAKSPYSAYLSTGADGRSASGVQC